MKVFQYIVENKEWLFSGAGVSAVILVATATYRYFRHNSKRVKNETNKMINLQHTNDKSVYVSETPPDGTKCLVGTPFIKTWTIRNVGTVIWRKRYLKCDPLPAYMHVDKEKVKIPKVLPGQEYSLQVTYTIDYEGVYHSYWKMYDENNNMTFPDLEGLGVTIIAERGNKKS